MHKQLKKSRDHARSNLLIALKECSRARDLKRGKDLHAQAVNAGHLSNEYVVNSLINMYAKCGSMVEARNLFNKTKRRDTVSWNALLHGYVEYGESEVALKLFGSMQADGTSAVPNERTYVSALTACASLASRKAGMDGNIWLEKGRVIHFEAVKNRCCNIFVQNALIYLYGQCGSMAESRKVFDGMNVRTVVSWNALLHGYVENGESELALKIVHAMEESSCYPDARTYVAALGACVDLATRNDGRLMDWLGAGRAIHSKALANHSYDMFVESMLVNMYAKCGSMVEAQGVFSNMVHRDVVAWNALLQGYVENGLCELALELFHSMGNGMCRPDARTYSAALEACAALAAERLTERDKWLETGKRIHARSVANRCCDIFVDSMLVDMYAKSGKMVEARKIFEAMVQRDVVTWTSLLQGYVDNGECELALRLFDDMESGGCAPDPRAYVLALTACASLAAERDGRCNRTWLSRGKAIHSRALMNNRCDSFVDNALVTMYTRSGCTMDARILFDSMAARTTVTWNCVARGYVDNGENELALEFICGMDAKGVTKNSATFVAALAACGNVMDSSTGRAFHAELLRLGLEEDVLVATSLVDLYGKCGSLQVAEATFDNIIVKDTWAWNTLIGAYSRVGCTTRALQLLDELEKEKTSPNKVTFTHILNACSHAGESDRGKECFEKMWHVYGIKPDITHYSCIVDLLGRSNHLKEALELVKKMPVEANAVVWRTLLGACRKWNDVDIGRLAYEKLVALDGHNAATYVLMSNLCGEHNSW